MVMPLEDHAGDIIRKSRMGRGVSATEVASRAGLTQEQLEQFEEHGSTNSNPNFEAVAELLTLDPRKLRQVAEGWEPRAHDMHQWTHFRHIETDDGGMAVNCFLVWDDATKAGALFDTGWVLPPIQALIETHSIQLQHIFITHSHYDHIEALADVRRFAPDALLHSNIKSAPKAQQLDHGETFVIGSLTVSFRETPGHADDGVTYIVDGFPLNQPRLAIVGDAIFAGSMGGAPKHFELARNKVIEEVLSLPGDSLICPGHGPLTTVNEERDHNPFFPAARLS